MKPGRSGRSIEHEPTFTGLTFDEMCETLRAEEINLNELSPDAASGIKNCVVQFNDSKPGLLHLLWYYQDALREGVRDNPEASSFFDRLSVVGLVVLHPTAGYALTPDDGRPFLVAQGTNHCRSLSCPLPTFSSICPEADLPPLDAGDLSQPTPSPDVRTWDDYYPGRAHLRNSEMT